MSARPSPPTGSPVAAPAERVAGVLDHDHALFAQRLERLEVDRQARRARPAMQALTPSARAGRDRRRRVEVPRVGVDVGETWPRADVERAVRGRDEATAAS